MTKDTMNNDVMTKDTMNNDVMTKPSITNGRKDESHYEETPYRFRALASWCNG